MHKFSSYSEAANEARKLAVETKQSVKVLRDRNEWIISSKDNASFEQAESDDLDAIFNRKKGDLTTNYDKEPF